MPQMLTQRAITGRHVVVREWERAVVVKDGTVLRVETAGRHRRGRREEWWVVDIRSRRIVLPPQEVLTADGLQVRVSLFLELSITDARAWVTETSDPTSELYALGQIALRQVVAALTLEALLAAREEIAAGVDGIRAAATRFGAEVASFDVRDITLPQELRQAFGATALAKAEGAAKIERARGEAAAVRSLANTAQVLEAHPSILQLRALDSAGQVIVKIGVPADGDPA
jgi:regulator of protease activity HflC (stomatin/prohibitin superfamily)